MSSLSQIEHALGFSEIRRQLLEKCHTPFGREMAAGDFFMKKAEEILPAMQQTTEMKYVLEFEGGIPAMAHEDVRPEIDRIKTPGTAIEIESLIDIAFIIASVHRIKGIFAKNKECCPLLHEICEEQSYTFSLSQNIDAIIDENGEIRSSASEKLKEIRTSIEKQRKKIEKSIYGILQNLKDKGIVEEDINLSIRNGRLVIPMPAAKKRAIKGVVLDESATGQTAFVEPIEIFELNNSIQDLEHEEKREIKRILIAITDEIRPLSSEILKNAAFLGFLDFIKAKAQLAINQSANAVIVSNEKRLVLVNARHPVLESSLKKQGRYIVPLNLELNPEERIMLISGPNAGGKSVAMKTAGLMQYMFQCGFLIPAGEGSEMFAFDNIFSDIGDQQSIENDLSTYSSHLLNMKNFLENANSNSLILIDEFGSGTEPESGGAIAEAVLNGLNNKEVFGIITTHYFNLKMFASNNEGLVNAAMLFDNERLRPQYVLKSGKPGSSFALEIASAIGLPKNILNAAGENIGQGRIELENMVQDLENEKHKLEERRRELSMAEDFVNELIQKYEGLNKSILDKRDRIIRKAEHDAERKLDKANALIEKTIREIKESGAEQQKSKKIRKDFEKEKLEISGGKEPELEQLPLMKTGKREDKKITPSAKGDMVRLENGNELGEVIEIKGKKAKVAFSHAQLEISLDKLVKVDQKKAQKIAPRAKVMIEEKKLAATLDLRGKRADEALDELDKFIDQALLLGVRSFSILHGKGHGILRKIIRDQLHDYRDILRYEDAHIDAGGDGITEVKFL